MSDDYEQLGPGNGPVPPPPPPPPPGQEKWSPLVSPAAEGGDYEVLGVPGSEPPPPGKFKAPKSVKKSEKTGCSNSRATAKGKGDDKKKKKKKSSKRKHAEESSGNDFDESEGFSRRALCTFNCVCCTLAALAITVLVLGAAVIALHLSHAVNWIPGINEFYNKTFNE